MCYVHVLFFCCLFVRFIGWGFLGFLSPPFFLFVCVLYTYMYMHMYMYVSMYMYICMRENVYNVVCVFLF